MLLLGIGFAKKNWNSLTKRLQKQLSHQLSTAYFVDPRLNTGMEKDSEDIQKILVNISNLKPDWILLYSKYFENPALCIKLIDVLRNMSHKNIYFVMVMDNIKQNLNSFLKFIPEIELVNKMNLKLSTSELILDQRIKSFPRIRLNSEFNRMKYRNDVGDFVNYSADEIPENSLIPLKYIERFETDMGEMPPEKWIQRILRENESDIKNHQVLGIFCEKKGCYLFPGIPFYSILNLKIKNTKIDYLMLSDEYKIKNPFFKRIVKKMKEDYNSWEEGNNKFPKAKCSPIYGFTKYSILKNVLENIFTEMGLSNLQIISDPKLLKSVFKVPVNWISLDNLYSPTKYITNIDWSDDYKKILSSVKSAIEINELEFIKNFKALPLGKIEFEEFLKKNSIKEMKINNLIKNLELEKKIICQKLEVLKKLDSLTKILINVLPYSINWNEAYDNSNKIKNKKIILFCEEENRAAELNLKLKGVNKKLWINPFKFHEPEDLVQINTKMIKSYLRPGTVIINQDAKKYLGKLCIQTEKDYKITKLDINDKILKIKYYKTDMRLIYKNKKNLALRWLILSFKQLLYRDRNLLNSIYK